MLVLFRIITYIEIQYILRQKYLEWLATTRRWLGVRTRKRHVVRVEKI